MRNRLLTLGILLLSLLMVLPSEAKSKKNKKTQAAQGIVVSTVDSTGQTLVLTVGGNKQTLSYHVLGAIITIDGEAAKLEQIKPGMHVITYTEADEHVLSQLDVSEKSGK